MAEAITAQELLQHLKHLEAAARTEEVSSAAAEKPRALDVLKLLRKQRVTQEVLESTKAGKAIAKLGKHGDSDIAAAANETVLAWKKCIKEGMAKAETTSSHPSQPTAAAPPSSSQPSAAVGKGGGPGPAPRTGDAQRDKVIDVLAAALQQAATGDNHLEGDPAALAAEVEQAMFGRFPPGGDGKVSADYKAKFRSLSFNLKDEGNADLRCNVLCGYIPPERLVEMTPEELASKDKQAEYHSIREKMKKEVVRGISQMASTDMFQCGKCKQRKTTYFQMQTRSADEPMTTFVTCVVCNAKWKFC